MQTYFEKFNYSLANEDASVEKSVGAPFRKILAIAGSGARLIPHLNADLETLTAVDVSADQLNYLKLKRSLVTQLSDDEYLKCLGYRRCARDERLAMINRINLPDDERRLALWDSSLDRGLIYQGAWESKLLARGRLIRRLLGVDFTPLFEATSMDDQRERFRELWPKWRLHFLLKALASRGAINRAIYGGGLPTESDESLPDLLARGFERLFLERPARSSFFHQLLFLGELRYDDGWPLETTNESLRNFREFGDRINFRQSDILSALGDDEHDFLSLSDVASYLPGPALRELERILAKCKNLERALVRTFLRHPHLKPHGWTVSEISRDRDTTALYRIQVFSRTKDQS